LCDAPKAGRARVEVVQEPRRCDQRRARVVAAWIAGDKALRDGAAQQAVFRRVSRDTVAGTHACGEFSAVGISFAYATATAAGLLRARPHWFRRPDIQPAA